jgi:phosphoribosyl 1,2-cyclic phosphate phosphodiesterase
MRAQMLLARPERIDAVLFTHAHADHTAGLDELRRFNIMQKERIPVWATERTAGELQQRFSYAFNHDFSFFGGKPDLDLNIFDEHTPFSVAGVEITPIPINHGSLPIVGFRIGGMAYVTDVKTIPAESGALLDDTDVLVLTALRQKEHVAHMSLAEALETVRQHPSKQVYLTHIAHDLGLSGSVSDTLPDGVALATDGLVISGITSSPR